MLVTSPEYLAAILALSRTDKITGTLAKSDGSTMELGDGNIEDGSVSISWECASGEEIEFGSAVMAQLDFSLRTKESRYVFYGAGVDLTYSVLLPGGSWFDIPLGKFTVSEAERKQSLVRLTAYDNLLAMDEEFGSTVLYGTPFQIFTTICEHCKLTLATTEEEFLSMPNGAEVIQIDETSGCTNWRDSAKVVAQMLGAFVTADRSGAIAIKRYGKGKCLTIPRKNRFSTTMADYICSYMGIRITSTSGEYRAYDDTQEKGLEFTIENAPAWDYGVEETLRGRTDALLNELIQIVYTPGSLSLPGNPAVECGDMLELETEDGTVTTLVTSVTWKYRGKMTLESAGVNPYLQGRVTRKTVVLRELQRQTENNKLIFYSFTNQREITVSGSDPEEISSITFATTKQTSAMFIAQLPLIVESEDTVTTNTSKTETEYPVIPSAPVVDADGNEITMSVKVTDTDTTIETTHGYVDVQIEYYLMGTLVEYELVQRLYTGKHILALFYAFDSLDGDSSYLWQVKIKIVGGSGTVTVPKNGLIATVTGQGMAGTGKWDGTLEFDESVFPFEIKNLPMGSAYGEVITETQTPDGGSITEVVPGFVIRSLSIANISERVSAGEIRVKETLTDSDWNYNNRYIGVEDNSLMARVKWAYESEESPIDSGRMAIVKSITNDLASVGEVIVSG